MIIKGYIEFITEAKKPDHTDEIRNIHNRASGEYKKVFKKYGARMWNMDMAHELRPEHMEFMKKHKDAAKSYILPRPLTVLDSYPEARKHIKKIKSETNAIHARYSAELKKHQKTIK